MGQRQLAIACRLLLLIFVVFTVTPSHATQPSPQGDDHTCPQLRGTYRCDGGVKNGGFDVTFITGEAMDVPVYYMDDLLLVPDNNLRNFPSNENQTERIYRATCGEQSILMDYQSTLLDEQKSIAGSLQGKYIITKIENGIRYQMKGEVTWRGVIYPADEYYTCPLVD